jgi:hypothetical protein
LKRTIDSLRLRKIMMCLSVAGGRGLALVLGLLVAGCASVVRGTTEAVQFDSEPSGAEMRSVIENACTEGCAAEPNAEHPATLPMEGYTPPPLKPGPACVTPCTLQIDRKDVLLATFTKPGFEPQTVKVGTQVNGGAGAGSLVGNAIIGGAVGVVVDAGTGAALDHVPNPVKVTLKPVAPAAPRKEARSSKRR